MTNKLSATSRDCEMREDFILEKVSTWPFGDLFHVLAGNKEFLSYNQRDEKPKDPSQKSKIVLAWFSEIERFPKFRVAAYIFLNY